MGKIVAIGGYEFHSKDGSVIRTPIAIDKAIIKLSEKRKPKLLFIPTASRDSKNYRKAIANIYTEKLGCEYDELLLFEEKPSRTKIDQKIKSADILYVGGGNTLMMMKKWRKLGIDKLLMREHKKGKVLCGVSAGSICWFEYGISDSLPLYCRVTGLGILPGTNNPHFGSHKHDKGLRTKAMKRIMKRTKGSCLAIPDGTALIFENGKFSILPKTAKITKAWWEGGEYQQVLL